MLRAAHAQLLALGRHPGPADPTREEAIRANRRAQAVYRTLGAPTCVRLLHRSTAQLRGS